MKNNKFLTLVESILSENDALENAINDANIAFTNTLVQTNSQGPESEHLFAPIISLSNSKDDAQIKFINDNGSSAGEWGVYHLLYGDNKADYNGETLSQEPNDPSSQVFISKHRNIHRRATPISEVMNMLFKLFPESIFSKEEAIDTDTDTDVDTDENGDKINNPEGDNSINEGPTEKDFAMHWENLIKFVEFLKGMTGHKKFGKKVKTLIDKFEGTADDLHDVGMDIFADNAVEKKVEAAKQAELTAKEAAQAVKDAMKNKKKK